MESYSTAVRALLKFADLPREATALARALLGSTLTEPQYRALLAAVGAFAKDNESYFLRYDDIKAPVPNELRSQFESWLDSMEKRDDEALRWLVFRKPNEPRMRAAYEVLAGWVLKFLYQTWGAIPVDYADGQARIWWPEARAEEVKNIWKTFQEWFLNNHKHLLEQNVRMLLTLLKKDLRGTKKVYLPKGELFDTAGSIICEYGYETPRRKKVTNLPPFSINGCPNYLDTLASPCLFCGSLNGIKRIGVKLVIPESKKIWTDSPGTREHPTICPECFFAALISGFYPSEAYSVCELPIASAYQTFVLAQRLSNVTASLGAMAIARSALLTVLPSRYFLVQLATGRRALPKKTQLYLLLADYSFSFPADGGAIRAYVEATGAINYLNIHLDVLRILNLFRRGEVLPPHFVTDGKSKARANDAVHLLEAGKPYAALYRLLYDPYKKAEEQRGWLGERSLFKSPNTLATFDEIVQQGARTLLEFLLRGGESKMLTRDDPGAFYQDVKDLSDALYDLLQPIAQDDVNKSRSNVSVEVRKYVKAVEKRFPQLNLVELQYMVAKAGDDAEKRRTAGETVYVKGKEGLLQGLDDIERKVAEMYGKYFQSGNAYIWREFIKEVSQRLLARLLLGVRAASQR
ncbi:MAG TPA: hypothetical protein GXX40_01730 [Firmicutes bacterium]|nr:hypothetical protein [Bacillota bacterium]